MDVDENNVSGKKLAEIIPYPVIFYKEIDYCGY